MPGPGREAENWLSAWGRVAGTKKGEAYGLMVVRERERRKESVTEASAVVDRG